MAGIAAGRSIIRLSCLFAAIAALAIAALAVAYERQARVVFHRTPVRRQEPIEGKQDFADQVVVEDVRRVRRDQPFGDERLAGGPFP